MAGTPNLDGRTTMAESHAQRAVAVGGSSTPSAAGGPVPVPDHVSFDAPFSDDYEDDGAPPGRSLADAIRMGLAKRGVRCDELDESDYAYSFRAESGAARALLMIGHVGDDEGRQWLVFADGGKEGGLLRRRPVDVTPLVEALHDVVVEDLAATPQWFTEQQWNDPSFALGRPTPVDG